MSLLAGGQNPITLEHQIYPPTIDTLVTGMTWHARVAWRVDVADDQDNDRDDHDG